VAPDTMVPKSVIGRCRPAKYARKARKPLTGVWPRRSITAAAAMARITIPSVTKLICRRNKSNAKAARASTPNIRGGLALSRHILFLPRGRQIVFLAQYTGGVRLMGMRRERPPGAGFHRL